jgi:hypothetical protein
MTEISTIGVAGIDGVVPVYDPTARWCFWAIGEIYVGTVGARRYVPKLHDYVIDPDTFTTWIVEHIDPVTLIARLRVIRPANMSYDFADTDILFGVGPGTQSDTYRVYLDQSVTPHILAVDARLRINGSMSAYMKLFKGADVSIVGNIISRLYDASGNVLTDAIPLEVVATMYDNNLAVKIPGVCYTNVALIDGELVTAVFYTPEGHVVSKRQLLIENTAFIRGQTVSQKYIVSINLESPFLSPTLDSIIEFPLNTPINALNLIGVIHYSDGTLLKLPVNGTRFSMFGLDHLLSTIIGQEIELVLSYQLAANEAAYGIEAAENGCITTPYRLVITEANNTIAVKVVGYPVWISQTAGYEMRWFLFNLDRNIFFDVTQHVRFAENTGPYNPKGYGYLQEKAIIVNLQSVSPVFRPFLHTQFFSIVLMRQPDGRQTPWTVLQEMGAGNAVYGENIFAISNTVNRTVEIHCSCANYTDWIRKLYLNTYPLINRQTEAAPPMPTHFELRYENTAVEYTVSEWNRVLTTQLVLPLYSTLFIRFIKRTATGDMNLSMSGMLVTN